MNDTVPETETVNLHPYLCFMVEPDFQGCTIVFAPNRRRAKALGWQTWPGLSAEYIETRVRRLDDDYMLFAETDEPHAVDSCGGDHETWEDALNELRQPTHRLERGG